MLYRSSLFLASNRVTSVERIVASTWAEGVINGCLGQHHLDILEACFASQRKLIKGNDGAVGVVVDPYFVKKCLSKSNSNNLKKHLNQMSESIINMQFFSGDFLVKANCPIISKIDTHEVVFCPHIKKEREILAIYFPMWFIELCKAPPYYSPRDVFYDLQTPLKKAINRFIYSLKGYKSIITSKSICNELGIPLTRLALREAEDILKELL